MKVPYRPGQGNGEPDGKGVPREMESEPTRSTRSALAGTKGLVSASYHAHHSPGMMSWFIRLPDSHEFLQ